jgi:hypothetical protein
LPHVNCICIKRSKMSKFTFNFKWN